MFWKIKIINFVFRVIKTFRLLSFSLLSISPISFLFRFIYPFSFPSIFPFFFLSFLSIFSFFPSINRSFFFLFYLSFYSFLILFFLSYFCFVLFLPPSIYQKLFFSSILQKNIHISYFYSIIRLHKYYIYLTNIVELF